MPLLPASRLLTPRRLLLVLLLLAAAGAGSWYVHSRGGWVNTLQMPPVLDASTPKSQNGFTLLDVQRPEQFGYQYGGSFSGFRYHSMAYQAVSGTGSVDTTDAFGLWIKPPPNSLLNENGTDSGSRKYDKDLSVTARLSTGEVIPLEWHLGNQGSGLPLGAAVNSLVLVTLPSGYSDACRFVDFTISDQSGHAAHWRIIQLPQMRHDVPPQSATNNTVTKEGITMSAKVWHGQKGEIEYLLGPVLPPHSHQWDVRITGVSQEWEPYDYDGQNHDGITDEYMIGTLITGRNGVFNTGFERWYGGGIYGYARSDPYPDMNHFLRLTTELRQFETYDEPVTFHNVAVQYDQEEYLADHEKVYYLALPQPLTVTTPSGVTVTIPAQGKHFRPTPYGEALNFFLTVQPRIQDSPVAYSLPNSPLARKFGKPVRISLTFPPPYYLTGWSSAGDSAPPSYGMALPLNPAWYLSKRGKPAVPMHNDLPPVLKDFTIIIHQRVDIQTIPMTFTLPISPRGPRRLDMTTLP